MAEQSSNKTNKYSPMLADLRAMLLPPDVAAKDELGNYVTKKKDSIAKTFGNNFSSGYSKGSNEGTQQVANDKHIPVNDISGGTGAGMELE